MRVRCQHGLVKSAVRCVLWVGQRNPVCSSGKYTCIRCKHSHDPLQQSVHRARSQRRLRYASLGHSNITCSLHNSWLHYSPAVPLTGRALEMRPACCHAAARC